MSSWIHRRPGCLGACRWLVRQRRGQRRGRGGGHCFGRWRLGRGGPACAMLCVKDAVGANADGRRERLVRSESPSRRSWLRVLTAGSEVRVTPGEPSLCPANFRSPLVDSATARRPVRLKREMPLFRRGLRDRLAKPKSAGENAESRQEGDRGRAGGEKGRSESRDGRETRHSG